MQCVLPVWAVLILCIEICEVITQRLDWVRSKENWLQTIHLVMVCLYLVLLHLQHQDWTLLAAAVVFLAWIDLSMAMRFLQFGKISALGLYMSMLVDVSLEGKDHFVPSLTIYVRSRRK